MTLVAGVDSSTQSCKVVIRDAETGALARSGVAKHPDGTEVDPAAWWDALQSAIAQAGGLDDVAALAVGGQQHGMVALDAAGQVIRPALLWNDTRSAGAAVDLIAELGTLRGSGPDDGPRAFVEATGTLPVASITATKLRWLAEAEPDNAARVAAVALPHDWLTWMLRGGPEAGLGALATDRSDASGTGYFDPLSSTYDRGVLSLALRRDADGVVLPRVAGPGERVGTTRGGVVLGPGCGDNAGAALGLAMGAGDVSISIGTSGVVAAVTDTVVKDPTGTVTGFADATGRYLPLAVTLNGAQVLDAVRALLGVDFAEFDRLALGAAPGAGGLTLVPYFAGERTPNLPHATASMLGLTLAGATRENLARAAIEGLLCGLADGLAAIEALGVPVRRVLLIGGGAKAESVRRIAPSVLGREVEVPAAGEYVADGAARQAAWALLGELPAWGPAGVETYSAEPAPAVRDAYAARHHLVAESTENPAHHPEETSC